MSDGFEIFGWFIYFWLFIFSKKFRTAWLQEYKEGGIPEKLYKYWEAIVSILFGVIPIIILFYILRGVYFNAI